jgi:hypothetical protein
MVAYRCRTCQVNDSRWVYSNALFGIIFLFSFSLVWMLGLLV